jgi:UDP-GlcNAc3NAcA epimerase
MKICTVIGARPQFVKVAPVSCALAAQGCQEVLVHTGQHYDYAMSETFFQELHIRAPDYNLGGGSGLHGAQTGQMLIQIEQVLLTEQPDWVLVYGDTNSTLAGALAAVKLHLPVAHVEAGLRSFNRAMPEEYNRLLTDHAADVLFCPTQRAVRNLAAEGISHSVYEVGDVMLDALLQSLPLARRKSDILARLDLKAGGYALVTIHRAGNTDEPGRFGQIVEALNRVSEKIVFPVHPRTRNALARIDVRFASHVRLIEPVGYFDMMMLEENARLIATDSGGVQREAYFLGIPCLTLRDETEWGETVQVGWNKLIGIEPDHILAAWRNFTPPVERPPIFGDGTAAQRIAQILGD